MGPQCCQLETQLLHTPFFPGCSQNHPQGGFAVSMQPQVRGLSPVPRFPLLHPHLLPPLLLAQPPPRRKTPPGPFPPPPTPQPHLQPQPPPHPQPLSPILPVPGLCQPPASAAPHQNKHLPARSHQLSQPGAGPQRHPPAPLVHPGGLKGLVPILRGPVPALLCMGTVAGAMNMGGDGPCPPPHTAVPGQEGKEGWHRPLALTGTPIPASSPNPTGKAGQWGLCNALKHTEKAKPSP